MPGPSLVQVDRVLEDFVDVTVEGSRRTGCDGHNDDKGHVRSQRHHQFVLLGVCPAHNPFGPADSPVRTRKGRRRLPRTSARNVEEGKG